MYTKRQAFAGTHEGNPRFILRGFNKDDHGAGGEQVTSWKLAL